MIKLKDLLLEVADFIQFGSLQLSFDDRNSIAFTYIIKWDIVLTAESDTHGNFRDTDEIRRYFDEEISDDDAYNYDRGEYTAHFIEGRLWNSKKIFSMWQYPKKPVFLKILNKLEEKGLYIDDTWRMEVFKYVGSNDIEHIDIERAYRDVRAGMLKPKLIRVKDYK